MGVSLSYWLLKELHGKPTYHATNFANKLPKIESNKSKINKVSQERTNFALPLGHCFSFAFNTQ